MGRLEHDLLAGQQPSKPITWTGDSARPNFFGIDYHFTTAEGWFSQQLVKQHRLYGDDYLRVSCQIE